jgi:hypothetical protein
MMEFPITELAVPVFDELIALIRSFKEDEFNLQPVAGGWSAAQAAEHIRLSVSGMEAILSGVSVETDRDPQQYVDAIRDIFMDFGRKMQSPARIAPADTTYALDAMAASFTAFGRRLQQIIEEEDLSCTYPDASLPGFPPFTRVEWLAFAMYHTQRHIHQMRGISARL